MNRVVVLLLGAWAGAMAVTTLTAIRAFKMMETKEAAGDFMGGLFKIVDMAGIVAAGLAALVWFRSKPRMIGAVLLLAGAAVSAFYLNPKVVARTDLETWHRVSEILWTALFAGAVALTLTAPKKLSERGGLGA